MDDGSAEHLILDFFDLFRDWLAATLLFWHRTEQSAALSRESRPSGSAQHLLQLPEASTPKSSPSLETGVNLADVTLSDVSTTTGLFVVVVFSHSYVSRGNCSCVLGVYYSISKLKRLYSSKSSLIFATSNYACLRFCNRNLCYDWHLVLTFEKAASQRQPRLSQ